MFVLMVKHVCTCYWGIECIPSHFASKTKFVFKSDSPTSKSLGNSGLTASLASEPAGARPKISELFAYSKRHTCVWKPALTKIDIPFIQHADRPPSHFRGLPTSNPGSNPASQNSTGINRTTLPGHQTIIKACKQHVCRKNFDGLS